MRILILHRISNDLVRYDIGLDHERHEITYIGAEDRIAALPGHLRCTRIVRPGTGDTATEVLDLVRDLPKPDIVIAMSEYDLLAAGEVREGLGVDGDHVVDVLPVRDKVVMKTAVAKAGLRVPIFLDLDEALAAEQAPWDGPAVIKPKDGASSQDVLTFPSFAEAMAYVRQDGLPGGAASSGFEVEEFISGPIIHVDGFLVDGAAVGIEASRYVGTCLDYATGTPLGSVQIERDDAIIDWAMACLHAVGIQTALFHLEAIESPTGLVFLEVGARFGGADVVDTFELATGIHMPSAYLRMVADGVRPLPTAMSSDGVRGRRYGWFVWPGHHLGADHCAIDGETDFRNSGLVHRWVQRTPDEVIKTAVSYSAIDIPLAGIVGPATSEELHVFFEKMFDSISVRAEIRTENHVATV